MDIFKYEVTCLYCEYFEYNYFENLNFYQKGLCSVTKKSCSINNKICPDFKLRSGMHTNKSYPGKQE